MRHGGQNEKCDEQADTAIGDRRPSEHNRKDRAAFSQPLRHEVGNRRDGAAVVHELREKRPKQKNGEELGEEAGSASHEALRPMGKQRFSREGCGDKCGGGREQQHAPAAIGEPDEQAEREENAGKPHCFIRSAEGCRGRRRSAARCLRDALEETHPSHVGLNHAACRRTPIRR